MKVIYERYKDVDGGLYSHKTDETELEQYEIEPVEGDFGHDANGIRCYYCVPVDGRELEWVPMANDDNDKTLVGPITITVMSTSGWEIYQEELQRLRDKVKAAEEAYHKGQEIRNEQRLANAKKW